MNRRDFLSRLPFFAAVPLAGGGGPSGLFPMADYGARVTASEQTNASAFYRALDAANRAGGVLQVDARYPVSNLILDGHHRAAITGLGRGRSALIGGTGDNALLAVVRSNLVEVRDLDLETQGIAAVYGLTSEGLHLTNVSTSGGRMAGVFLDRCAAPDFRHVAARGVRLHSPGVGGCGIWWMRGGTQGRMADCRVEDLDGDGFRFDASSRDGLPATIPDRLVLMGLAVSDAGKATTNAAAIMFEGAAYCTLTSFQIAAMRGHGLVLQQDQSGAVPTGNLLHTGIIHGITGYAVACLGAQHNEVGMVMWDGSGAGAVLQAPGLGGSGAASVGNTIDVAGPGRG